MPCQHIATAREHTPLVLMDRIDGEGGELINQLSIASITYREFQFAS